MTSTREASTTLEALARPGLVFPRLAGTDRASVLRELAGLVAEAGVVRDGVELYERLQERERLGSTGIGSGVAVPHCKVKGLDEVVMALGVASHGIDFEAADGLPVRLFFVLLSPHKQPAAHLRSLAAISRWVQHAGRLEKLLACHDPEEILATLGVEEAGD